MIRRFFLVFLLFHTSCLLWMFVPGTGSSTVTAQSTVSYWTRIKQFLSVTGSNSQELRKSVSTIDRYSRVYDWIHRQEKHTFDSLSRHGVTNWDRYQNIITYQYTPGQDSVLSTPLRSKATVFGWHPYWMGNAFRDYKFNLLSYVSWFSFHINTDTGEPQNPESLDKARIAELVTLAHEKKCRVLLTVTCHTPEETLAFLSDKAVQNHFIQYVCGFINEMKMDGADVNFENIPAGQTANMTEFIRNFSTELKKNRLYLTIDLPVFDFNHIYELPELGKNVDLFIITGYDYFNGKSRTNGPVSPLGAPDGSYSIRQSVDKYLQTGVDRGKLLLGLPYYGAVWAGSDDRDTSMEFKGHLTYRAIMAKYGAKGAVFDPVSCSKFHLIKPVPDSNYYEKCWFDDDYTLGEKFGWAISQDLAGVGIWALGYDNGYPDMWQMIARRYGTDTTAIIHTPEPINKVFNMSSSVSELSPLLIVTGLFMAGFFLLGLIMALFDWRVREVFFQNKTLRLIYLISGGSILMLTGSAIVMNNESGATSQTIMLMTGVIIGVLLTSFVFRLFEKNRSNIP
ncbi:MAG: glycosyl hydrolase family 18 protein [Bacteroidota bacterium]